MSFILLLITELTDRGKFYFKKAEQVCKSKKQIETSEAISVEDLTYAVVKYKMTGLDFVKEKNDSLGCKFKQLDPNDHDKVFQFSFKSHRTGSIYGWWLRATDRIWNCYSFVGKVEFIQ